MTVSDVQLQNQIIKDIGDTDAGDLAADIGAIWALYADKAQIAPRLQFLYAKREAVQEVMGSIRKNVDFTTPTLSVKLSQETDRLQDIYDRVQSEIEVVETRARANRPAVAALLVTTAPESPPLWWQGRDANARSLRGDPYRPGFRRTIR